MVTFSKKKDKNKNIKHSADCLLWSHGLWSLLFQLFIYYLKTVLLSDLDSPNRQTVVSAVELTSQLANHQNCPCSALFKAALFAV